MIKNEKIPEEIKKDKSEKKLVETKSALAALEKNLSIVMEMFRFKFFKCF